MPHKAKVDKSLRKNKSRRKPLDLIPLPEDSFIPLNTKIKPLPEGSFIPFDSSLQTLPGAGFACT